MTAERDVLFRLKVGEHPGNKAALDQFAKQFDSAQSKATGATEREAKKRESTIRKEAAAAAKALAEEAREREKIARLVSKSEEASRKYTTSLREGFVKAADGALLLGQGFVALGLAGEKDIEKIARTLLKVKGIVDLTKGAIQIYQGITTAVEAYRASVIAATAAETALGAARGRGAAAGGAAVAGRAAGSGTKLAGGAAALGGAGGAAAVAPVAIPIAIGAIIAALIVGIASIFSESLREKLKAIVGLDEESKRAAASLAKLTEAANKFREGAESEKTRLGIRDAGESSRISALTERRAFGKSEPFGAGVRVQDAATKLSNIETRLAEFRKAADPDSDGPSLSPDRGRELSRLNIGAEDVLALEDQRKQAVESLLDAEKTRLSVVKKSQDEAVEAERKKLGLIQQELATAKQKYEQEQQRLLSTEERLAQLDPLTAKRTLDAASVANSGGALTKEQADLLRGLGGIFDKQVQGADRSRITALGLDSIVDPLRKSTAAAGANVGTLTAAEQAQVAVNKQIEAKATQLVDSMTKTIQALLDRMIEEIEAETDRKLERERFGRNRAATEANRARLAAAE